MTIISHLAAGHVIGALTYQPEPRKTAKGQSVVNLTVKCEGEIDGRKWSGTYKAVLWGHQCDDFMAQNPAKDDLVEVEGRLANRKWDDNGVEKWVQEIVGSAKVLEAVPRNGKELPPDDGCPF